ncbi:MAG: hypothetical protein HY660_16625, partial [Armatimonadetes bacterium]|nr:hypothetical protein [Armatimonadota bacterium]
VYADGAFAIFDLLELMDIVVSLPEDTRRKPKCRISHLLRTRPPVS